MEYDAIIVGAGPAGLLSATRIAEGGDNVLVLEEHKRIGEPDHCAGLLSSSGLESLNLKPPDEAVQNLVSGARIFAPSGDSILIERGQREAIVIDRKRFDLWLSEIARKKGVDIATESKVKEIASSKAETRLIKTPAQTYETKVCLIAEGARSVLSKSVGFPIVSKHSRLPAYQYEVKGVDIEEDLVEMFYGRRYAPGFFAWIIPLRDGKARVGLASRSKSKVRLDSALKHHPIISERMKGAEKVRGLGGIVLVGKPVSRLSSDGLVIVGDTAGMVKATTGGGIIIGGLTARIAGESVAGALQQDVVTAKTLSKYDKLCKSMYYRELQTMYLAQKALTSLTDKGLDSVVRDAQDMGLLETVRKEGDMDLQGKVIRKLLSNPRTFLLGLKAIRYINPFL
ncbi:MAG: NAD(P)/FAD-dependent oxidoreductase [Candidatus Thorarchaeota archaeon]|nr:NAD(P)/FAD-dependent oxidoreductase [Candidatus Thorarchaeota archaeon]